MPAKRLAQDPFNPHSEPDQWIVEGGVERALVTALEERCFPELADPVALEVYCHLLEGDAAPALDLRETIDVTASVGAVG